jgi:DNA-binding MarR family transcriptional regulator
MFIGGGSLLTSRQGDGPNTAISTQKGGAVAANEQLIADIMAAQQRLQHLFVQDRADPIFDSHLTMPQLKILMLLYRRGEMSGRELASVLGVSLATLSGMIDRLVSHDMVTRHEDPHDRRVRRIDLSGTGNEMVERIVNAGNDLQKRLLNRLTPVELCAVLDGLKAMIRVAAEESRDANAGQGVRPA